MLCVEHAYDCFYKKKTLGFGGYLFSVCYPKIQISKQLNSFYRIVKHISRSRTPSYRRFSFPQPEMITWRIRKNVSDSDTDYA